MALGLEVFLYFVLAHYNHHGAETEESNTTSLRGFSPQHLNDLCSTNEAVLKLYEATLTKQTLDVNIYKTTEAKFIENVGDHIFSLHFTYN